MLINNIDRYIPSDPFDMDSEVGCLISKRHKDKISSFIKEGLDSGDILFHCLPYPMRDEGGFMFTMRAVEVAHNALVSSIANNSLLEIEPIPQSKSREIRYTRSTDFTDDVAREFLERPAPVDASTLDYPELRNPFFG